jgi:hypothetical protein
MATFCFKLWLQKNFKAGAGFKQETHLKQYDLENTINSGI